MDKVKIDKSHHAPVPYPTMHHSEQKCAHFCSECCIVGYGTGALWDLRIRSTYQRQTTTKDNKIQTHVHNCWDEWFPPHETCITSHPLLQISQFNYEKCKKSCISGLMQKKMKLQCICNGVTSLLHWAADILSWFIHNHKIYISEHNSINTHTL